MPFAAPTLLATAPGRPDPQVGPLEVVDALQVAEGQLTECPWRERRAALGCNHASRR